MAGLPRLSEAGCCAVCGLLAVVLVCGCSPRPDLHVKQRFYRMDTVTEVTIAAAPGTDLSAVWRGIDSLLLDWERRFSVEREGSEVRALNGSTDSVVAVTPELAGMLRDALRYADTLGGSFDVTVLPLKRVWGLDEGSMGDTAHVLPTDSMVAAALRTVDYRRVRVDPAQPRVTRAPGTLIDVGGIAKGCAIRDMCHLLDRLGHGNYLVCSGGDVAVSGRRRDHTPWIVGIQHPRSRDALLATVRVEHGCVVTSGDYERFWIAPDGRRVHHIFDPAAGQSCLRNQSVTIWCDDPVEADVFSTGLFCRPADEVLSFVEQRPGLLECVVVDSSGAVHASQGWKQKLQWR